MSFKYDLVVCDTQKKADFYNVRLGETVKVVGGSFVTEEEVKAYDRANQRHTDEDGEPINENPFLSKESIEPAVQALSGDIDRAVLREAIEKQGACS